MGEFDSAIGEYRRVLKLSPNLAAGHYGLAMALEKKGDQDGSRAALGRFLEIWQDADRDLPPYREAAQLLR